MSEHVLVTGASGFIGRALVDRLKAEGFGVTAAGRTAPPAPPGVRTVAIPASVAPEAWQAVLSGVDAVVHCAARAHVQDADPAQSLARFREANRDASLALAGAAAAAGVRRFVFLSSIGVNGGETKGSPLRHDDAPAPHSAYAVAKHEAELGLRDIAAETGLELVVIRPPLVMGPGARGNLGTLARFIARGLPLPFGLVTRNRRDLVSLATLVDLILVCLDHPAAAGQTFLVSDGAPLSTRALIERMAAEAGRKPRLLPVPPALLRWLLRAAGRSAMASQLLADLEVDIGHTVATLGWSPGTSRRRRGGPGRAATGN